MYAPYPYFTQRAIFDDPCVRRVPTHQTDTPMSAKFLATHGATLEEWAAYVSCFAGASGVNHTHASSASADAFRRDVVAAFTPRPSSAAGGGTAAVVTTGYIGKASPYHNTRGDRCTLSNSSRFVLFFHALFNTLRV